MKTKTNIVERLLEEKHITVKEAVILLTSNSISKVEKYQPNPFYNTDFLEKSSYCTSYCLQTQYCACLKRLKKINE